MKCFKIFCACINTKNLVQDLRYDDALNTSTEDDSSSTTSRRCKHTGPWSKEEDDVVMRLVGQYGPKRWSLIASNLPGRTGKQCRERWHNQLDPNIKKEGWTDEEDFILTKAHSEVTLVVRCSCNHAISHGFSFSLGTTGWRSRGSFPAAPTMPSRTAGTQPCASAPFRPRPGAFTHPW